MTQAITTYGSITISLSIHVRSDYGVYRYLRFAMLVRVDAIILTVSPVNPVFHKLKEKHIAYMDRFRKNQSKINLPVFISFFSLFIS